MQTIFQYCVFPGCGSVTCFKTEWRSFNTLNNKAIAPTQIYLNSYNITDFTSRNSSIFEGFEEIQNEDSGRGAECRPIPTVFIWWVKEGEHEGEAVENSSLFVFITGSCDISPEHHEKTKSMKQAPKKCLRNLSAELSVLWAVRPQCGCLLNIFLSVRTKGQVGKGHGSL